MRATFDLQTAWEDYRARMALDWIEVTTKRALWSTELGLLLVDRPPLRGQKTHAAVVLEPRPDDVTLPPPGELLLSAFTGQEWLRWATDDELYAAAFALAQEECFALVGSAFSAGRPAPDSLQGAQHTVDIVGLYVVARMGARITRDDLPTPTEAEMLRAVEAAQAAADIEAEREVAGRPAVVAVGAGIERATDVWLGDRPGADPYPGWSWGLPRPERPSRLSDLPFLTDPDESDDPDEETD